MLPTAIVSILLVTGADPQAESQVLTLEAVLLSAVEEADVAAREAGVVTELKVRRGQTVERDQLVAKIDDVDALVAREQRLIEVEISRERADNDVTVRHAQKTLAVAASELKRAQLAVKKYRQSISDGEMDRLRLTVERDTLAVEQSQHELRIAQATLRLKENALKLATLQVARRTVVAPFAGIVADVSQSRGQWVKPGDTVVRLLRIDRVRAEAFVDARYADAELLDRTVQLSLGPSAGDNATFQGKIVFVSPEIDPVNAQLLVWAEIDNTDLKLRPGQRATLTVDLVSALTEQEAKRTK